MANFYNAAVAIRAQRAFCEAHSVPVFIPGNGWCTRCGRNIFEPYTQRREPPVTIGISVEEAGSRHITGCPHCNATFAD